MILSVSRRTDIPAFYSEWFYNRIKEGFVYVRNPMNIHSVSKIDINPDVIDCIVFWTKNPLSMLPRLNDLKDYNYYFQFTVNPYDTTIESFVPKKKIIFDTFKRLSDLIGSERVIWRYDPILLSNEVSIEYHKRYFEVIAKNLAGYTNRCVISFIDNYKKTENNLKFTSVKSLDVFDIERVCNDISSIANVNKITIQSCAEKVDLDKFGIVHGSCIDREFIQKILNQRINAKKDKNQRNECHCIESIDIGEYNTCAHNCLYCYANFNSNIVNNKICMHNPSSPLLIGEPLSNDIISDRKVKSLINKILF